MVNHGVSHACLTWNSRRIRCDESKPACQGCAKPRRTCPGYQDRSGTAVRESASSSASVATVSHVSTPAPLGLQRIEGRPRRPQTAGDLAQQGISSVATVPALRMGTTKLRNDRKATTEPRYVLENLAFWPGNIDSYFDIYVAAVWDAYRQGRLKLLQLISDCSERLQSRYGSHSGNANCSSEGPA